MKNMKNPSKSFKIAPKSSMGARTLVASISRGGHPPTLLDFFRLEPSDLERNENWGPSFVRGLSAVYTHLIIFGHGRCASRKHVSVHKKASVQ